MWKVYSENEDERCHPPCLSMQKEGPMGARSIVRVWRLPGVGRNGWFKEERISVQNTTGSSVSPKQRMHDALESS